MKPYYEHAGITIYHGDCREILPTLPECQLLLSDPPYGVSWEGRRKVRPPFGKIVGDHNQDVATEGMHLAWQRLKSHRHAYVFGPECLHEHNQTKRVELIWDKCIMGCGNIDIPWGPSHEQIGFYVKVRPSEIEKESRPARMRRGSVLRFQALHGNAVSNHPTEKPVLLLRELIESSSRYGELVFDPFVGCGSTLVAAKYLGRRAIGIEIEERYCEIAAQRLAQEAFDFSDPI